MTYKEQIYRLLENMEGLQTDVIVDMIGCSRRTARHYRQEFFAGRFEGDSSTDGPKVLLLDVETSPMEAYIWDLVQRGGYIQPAFLKKPWAMLTWAAKWLFDDKIYSGRVNTSESHNRLDGSVVKPIWKLMDKAHVIVTHNGDRFDLKRLNARFALNNYPPVAPYQSIDTLKIAKSVFDIPAFKLNFLNKYFSLRQMKADAGGFQTWKDCVDGSTHEIRDAALQKMLAYNEQDILAGEDLYVKVRPWMKSHPNLALYMDSDEPMCSRCLNTELEYCGPYATMVSKFHAYRCTQCGGIVRSKTNIISKEKRKELLVSTAR
jgi:hypothetical protein